jgi:tetratricopeptide (TPR) repeat protein
MIRERTPAAMEIKSDHASHLKLGNDPQRQGWFDEAIAAYRQSIALHPACAEAHSNLGVALMGTGKMEEAIAAYSNALSVRPDLSRDLILIWGTHCMRRAKLTWRPPLLEARSPTTSIILVL